MQIVNIINFVRAAEPRVEDDSFLPYTLEEELKLCEHYDFPSTVLLQYDALIKPEYTDILRRHGKKAEIGLWFEIVEPLAKACDIPWRGRFSWDWHSDVGFLIGYTTEERKKLIDRAFDRFKEIFGYYPAVAGSWHIDAFSLRYMREKYHIVASCNCKDQYGTDGYTMWGGYWSGAYYPSVSNMFCPAADETEQIDVPVFRMLGSDPIYQYDLGLGAPEKAQAVISLEPVYGNSGATRQWVNNFFDVVFNGKGLALSYAQMGQENSFGWDKIRDGLTMQMEELQKRLKKGDIQLLTLGEAGKLFREAYKITPASAVCADKDTLGGNLKTVWYMSRCYRVNFLYDNKTIRLRDFFLFRSDFREKYLDRTEDTPVCFFSNVPLTDGFRFSDRTKTAGGYFRAGEDNIPFGNSFISEADNDTVTLKSGSDLSITAAPERLTIECAVPDFTLHFSYVPREYVRYTVISPEQLDILYYGHKESVFLAAGFFRAAAEEFEIVPENGSIIFECQATTEFRENS